MNSSKSLLRIAIVFAICILSMIIVVSADDDGVITGNGVNYRVSPSTDAAIISVLPKGTKVTAIGAVNDWIQVTYNGNCGYIHGDYFKVITNSNDATGGQAIVEYAKQFIGTRYTYGGNFPNTGFDCSGFTSYVYGQNGYSLNRTAAGQASNGISISKSELIAGDLVMFKNGGSGIGHVGIYVGNGMFIHSVKPGVPVSIDTLNSGYYGKNYVCARRIIG